MVPSMRVAALYSGGKDSTYALHWGFLQGHDIVCLVSIRPREYSMLLHYPCIEATLYQAKAMGFDILYASSGDNEEHALYNLLKRAMEEYGVRGVIAGVLLSDYQRMRIACITEKLGLALYTPLWRIDQEKYMYEVIGNGIKFIITSISSYGLSPKYIGRIITPKLLHEMIGVARRYGLNPAFEGGEAETLVVDAPLFRYKLRIRGKLVVKGPWEAQLVIEEIGLGDRPVVVVEDGGL